MWLLWVSKETHKNLILTALFDIEFYFIVSLFLLTFYFKINRADL